MIALQIFPEKDWIRGRPAEAVMATGGEIGYLAERVARQLVGRAQDCLWRGLSSLHCQPSRVPLPPPLSAPTRVRRSRTNHLA